MASLLIAGVFIGFGIWGVPAIPQIPDALSYVVVPVGIFVGSVWGPLIGLRRHVSVTDSSLWFRETRGRRERWIAEYVIEPGTIVLGGTKRAKWDIYFVGPENSFLDILSLWEFGFEDQQIKKIAQAIPGYEDNAEELKRALSVWIGDVSGPKRYEVFQKRTRNRWP